MTSRLLLLLLVLLNVHPLVKGQVSYDVSTIQESLKTGADATIRNECIEVNMKNPSNVTIRLTRAITVHNRNGETHGDIELYYNKSRKIKSVKGEIYNAFGNAIGKFSLKDFGDRSASGQSSLYDDTRMKNYSPAVYDYPYTIVYTAEMQQNQNLLIPSWMPDYAYDVALEQSTYIFSCDTAEKIRIDEQNFPAGVNIQEDATTKTYTWELRDVPARRFEPFSPPLDRQAIRVRIVPEHFQYFRKKGDVNNWNELGKWYYDYLLKDKRTLPDATIKQVLALTENLDTPKEKAKVLYEYMQNKTRYISIQVGIGGIEPFPASTVDELGYGDCKALVNYMQSLLDVVDIPSYYCVVEGGSYKRDISPDFANFGDGNHVILCLPFENDTTWLECTNQKIPFGFLGDFTDDRLVIACAQEGGKIMRTPTFSASESVQYREGHFKILTDGSIEGILKTTFKGGQFDNHYSNTYLSRQDQTNNLKDWYNVNQISFKNIDYQTQYDENDALTLYETIDLFIRNYVVNSGTHITFHPNAFNQSSPIPAIRNRSNEVYIQRGYTDIDVIHYTLPEGVNRTALPVEKLYATEMGTYELRISIADGVLTSYRKIEIREGTYSKDLYANFHQFMKDVYSADQGQYTLSILNEGG